MPAAALTQAFHPASPWRKSPDVGLRPEPFGALAYHFVTRRLVFLKSPELVELVEDLGQHPTADDAIAAAVEPSRRAAFAEALASLAESGVIVPGDRP